MPGVGKITLSLSCVRWESIVDFPALSNPTHRMDTDWEAVKRFPIMYCFYNCLSFSLSWSLVEYELWVDDSNEQDLQL